MKNPLYVVYDDDMNLLLITSVKPETGNFFITEKSKVRDFYLGYKSYPGHYVKNHGFNNFTIEEKVNTSGSYSYNDLVDISVNNFKTDLTIQYNLKTFSWIFLLDADIGNQIDEELYDNTIEFYLVKQNQYNFLIRTFKIKIKELINGPVEFSFENKIEESFENLLIKSKQHFKTIGINV